MIMAVTFAIAAVIAAVEVPYLVKNTFMKEVGVFVTLLFIAIGLSIVHDQEWML